MLRNDMSTITLAVCVGLFATSAQAKPHHKRASVDPRDARIEALESQVASSSAKFASCAPISKLPLQLARLPRL